MSDDEKPMSKMFDNPEVTRRLGRIRISDDIVYREPEAISFIMSKIVVLRAEAVPWLFHFEYVAYCEDFDIVPYGEVVPEYQGIFERDDNGIVSLSFKRVAKK